MHTMVHPGTHKNLHMPAPTAVRASLVFCLTQGFGNRHARANWKLFNTSVHAAYRR